MGQKAGGSGSCCIIGEGQCVPHWKTRRAHPV